MDTIEPLRFVFASLFVLSLIGLLALALKRWGACAMAMRGMEPGRLKIIETRYIDPKRKLVLVQRDEVEHLLLLSDGRELVVESNITPPGEKHFAMPSPKLELARKVPKL